MQRQKPEPETLADRCRDIIEWKSTGAFTGAATGDALRSYAKRIWGFLPVSEGERLSIAEAATLREAAEFVVAHDTSKIPSEKD